VNWKRANEQTIVSAQVDDDAFSLAVKSLVAQGSDYRRFDDVRAYAQAYLLIWSVTILLMFEDDAAMLACMFC
jgi:hypothetical protein